MPSPVWCNGKIPPMVYPWQKGTYPCRAEETFTVFHVAIGTDPGSIVL